MGWTTIPDSAIQPGAPVRSLDGLALRDNPIAIAEGLSGAPSVINNAFRDTLVGDIGLHSNITEQVSNSTSYVKVKETVISRAGNLRIKFNLRNSSSGTAYGRIYVNGIAKGTERSTTSTSEVTFTEDITGLNHNDLVQVYVRQTGGLNCFASNFLFFCDQAVETASML